ncbi:MAG: oligosaccharide flippase family protein [Candidatus Eisenbacteria bacterium]|nr:oligosaccharide flippase family protein [Candidatus Eisenbacteria bacterium]
MSRAVAPSVLGLFNSISLACGYAPFFQLGVVNGLNRDLPYHIGTGDWPRARELAAAAQAWALITGGFCAFVTLGIGGWQLLGGRGDLAFGWTTISLSVFMAVFGQMYLQSLFRTHSDFSRLAAYNVIQALVSLALVPLVWAFGFHGLCGRAFLIAASSLMLLWRWRPLKVAFRLRWEPVRQLLKTGIPLLVVGQIYAWWTVLDSTLVLRYAGTEGLGLYALAALAGPTVGMVPHALSQVVYPRMAEEYGRTRHIRPLLRMVWSPVLQSFAVTALLVAVSWVALPYAVRMILPKYVGGIQAAQWSLVATLPLTFMPVNNVFNVVKRQDLLGAAIAFGMAVYVGVMFLLGGTHARLAAFPQAMLVGRVCFISLCVLLITRLRLHPDPR